MKHGRGIFRAGFTLLELVVVAAILIVLAGLVLPLFTSTQLTAEQQATTSTLNAVRQAIVGTASQPGYMHDNGTVPLKLASLFIAPAGSSTYNPATARGWHGPYLQDSTGTYTLNAANGFTADYGLANDPAVVDGWRRPLVLQIPSDGSNSSEKSLFARLVSAGPDGVIQTPSGALYPSMADRGDDMVVFLNRPDTQP